MYKRSEIPPYFFIGVLYCSEITTPPSSVRNFPFLNYSARPRTLLKARVRRLRYFMTNFIFKTFKKHPPPLSRSEESHHKVLACITRHFSDFQGVSISIYPKIFAIIELLKKARIFLYQLRIVKERRII